MVSTLFQVNPVVHFMQRRNVSAREGDKFIIIVECNILAVHLSFLGELTDVGRHSTHNFGVALRKVYIERLVASL